MTDPAIQHAERTGLAPGETLEPVERHYPITKSSDMDKSNRFKKQVKKLERLNKP